MTPKQLLDKMENEMVKSAVPEVKEILRAQYEGALVMYECFLEKQRRYYKSHAEHNKAYHRAYYKAHRGKQTVENPTEMEANIMKEVENIK